MVLIMKSVHLEWTRLMLLQIVMCIKINAKIQVISSGLWPPRSPDLTPCNLYLWECPKD
jgi:hypothetical protein